MARKRHVALGTSHVARGVAYCFVALLVAACSVGPAPATQGSGNGAGTGGINRPDQREKPHLVVVSFDGFRTDYLDRFDLPNFRRVMQRGARARALRPVFPSSTFANHYSLVTGLYPERHGLVENSFYDPARKAPYSFRDDRAVGDGSWYRGEPIWVTAETQGMVSACFFWPGSEAPITGVRPTFWNKYEGTIPNAVRVETVLEWLRLPTDRRPHVITLYFSELDSASHNGSLDGDGVARAAQSLDASLGQLLDGVDALPIRHRIYLLLTSDHGMAETSAEQAVRLDTLIDPARVRVGFSGPVASLHVTDAGDARAIRDQINQRLTHGRAYLREEIPERLHYRANPRIGDILILMDEGWRLTTSVVTRALIQKQWGDHGWDNGLESMRAIFILAGPGIGQGITIPEVENIDVYPLMTELLGLRAASDIDGRAGWIRSLVVAR